MANSGSKAAKSKTSQAANTNPSLEEHVKLLIKKVDEQQKQIDSFNEKFDTEVKIVSYNIREDHMKDIVRMRDSAQSLVNELNKVISKNKMSELLHAGMLHKRKSHPSFIYRAVKHDDPKSLDLMKAPPGTGWVVNKFAGDSGKEIAGEKCVMHWMKDKTTPIEIKKAIIAKK